MLAKIVLFVLLISFSSKSSSAALDLGDACQKMWDSAAGNTLDVPSEIKIDTVGKNPLVTLKPAVETKVDASDVFKTFRELLTDTSEPKMNAFLNVITQSGGPLDQALKYLNANVYKASKKSMAEFKTILKGAWFTPFPGKGFKHVFIGDRFTKKGKNMYSGFHNWYQFYLLESVNQLGNVNLSSFTSNTKPSFIRMNFEWDKATKACPSSMYVGTSPAFDFALFSACFIGLYKGPSGENLGKDCTCKINNSNLTIRAIQTSPPKGSSTPTGKICTAFPTEVAADTASTSTCCENDGCCPTITTLTTSDSGSKDDYYYTKRGCFLIFYFCYSFIFY